MNTQTRIVALALGACLALAIPGSPAAANTSGVAIPKAPKFDKGNAKKYGKQLAYYLRALDTGWVDSYAKSRMILKDSGGDKVERDTTQMILEGADGNKSIARFLSPADIRGVSALTHEHPKATDDSWLYLPASRRVRRISGANRTASFQGTEFTYEDLSTVEPRRYDWKYLKEDKVKSDGKTVPVSLLEAIPNFKDTGYSKLTVYLNQQSWRVERMDFYDKAGRLLKTLTFSKWKRYHGRFWRPHLMDMQNRQTRKATAIKVKSMFLNLSLYKRKNGTPRSNLQDAQFTRRALENG